MTGSTGRMAGPWTLTTLTGSYARGGETMKLAKGESVTASRDRPGFTAGMHGQVIERGAAGSVFVRWENREVTTAWPEDLILPCGSAEALICAGTPAGP
jgi:hypothetical protein